MTDTPASQDAQPTLTLEGEDGHSYECEFLDRFEFEGNEYALLLKVNDEEDEEEEDEQSLVIMRCFERGNEFVFQTIESEEEFEKVVAYVEEKVEAEQAQLGDEE